MDIAEDIRRIALQEERLQFDGFGMAEAWEVGMALKAVGESGRLPIVVDIRLATMKLLAFALPGAAPDNFDWARRKRNVVFRFHRSSYAIGRKLALEGRTLADLGALPERDYARPWRKRANRVRGTGCVGAVTVSGLPQRDDHRTVVDAMARVLGSRNRRCRARLTEPCSAPPFSPFFLRCSLGRSASLWPVRGWRAAFGRSMRATFASAGMAGTERSTIRRPAAGPAW